MGGQTKFLLGGLALLLIIGGLVYQRSRPSSYSTNPEPTPSNITLRLQIANKKLIHGEEVTRVKQGDLVKMVIITDEDEELHLHGYDHSVELVKGSEANLEFDATMSGRFVYELEESKIDLGAIEVLP